MIVRITRAKVGHRQALNKQMALNRGPFALAREININMHLALGRHAIPGHYLIQSAARFIVAYYLVFCPIRFR